MQRTPRNLRLLLGLAALLTCVARDAERAAAESPTPSDEIRFLELDAATNAAATQGKVTALYFGAKWCKWCRKMKAVGMKDPAVATVGEAYVWSDVDIDDQPLVARQYGVRGVPALRLLNAKGEVVASRDSYLNPEQLLAFLTAHTNDFNATTPEADRQTHNTKQLERVRSMAKGPVPPGQVEGLLLGMARSRHSNRELVQALVELKAPAWPGLVQALQSEHLAVRAAAYTILRESSGASLAFDPFAPRASRSAQAQQWSAWLEGAKP